MKDFFEAVGAIVTLAFMVGVSVFGLVILAVGAVRLGRLLGGW